MPPCSINTTGMMNSLVSLKRLKGDFEALYNAVEAGQSVSLFSLSEFSKFHIAGNLDRFVLYVTLDRFYARKCAEYLSEYTKKPFVFIPEKEDVLILKEKSAKSSLEERNLALETILNGQASGAVITAEGLQQYFPSIEKFIGLSVKVKSGEKLNVYELIETLIASGYTREDAVGEKGTFSYRGEILDVWGIGKELPLRIMFFDDLVEEIREFDPETMVSVRKIGEAVFPPYSDFLLKDEHLKKLKERLSKKIDKAGPVLSDILSGLQTKLEENPTAPELSWLTPLITEGMSTIFDYLDESAVIVFDEARAINEKWKFYQNVLIKRVGDFVKSGEALEEHKDAIIDSTLIQTLYKPFRKVAYQQITTNNPLFDPEAVFSLKASSTPHYFRNIETLFTDVKNFDKSGFRILISAGSEAHAEALKKNLEASLINAVIVDEPREDLRIQITKKRYSGGFIYTKAHFVLIGAEDTLGREVKKMKATKKQLILPDAGDYVVHETFGIGISEGVQTLKTENGLKDYYVIHYKDDDRLYLPVDRMDKVEKYLGGENPSIHKLGSKEFEKLKERVKAAIKEMAIDLMDLYQKRSRSVGHKYGPDTDWQKEMEDEFEYNETEDQLIASSEIKEDMEKGKVMDRLLAGDVGFGKTEVALRAIFKTVLEGKQAAFLAPTTILSEQHYNTVKARFNKYMIDVALLNRFVPKDKQKNILERLKDGKISLIIGTHRLLSSDIAFNDLGLLVLDEEQRFGVEQKEKLKLLKTNVNVLSLSATPIPRTLNMSLVGIRDISTLDTPPSMRLPVETYVTEYSDALVRDAVIREINRDGQVFILYNNVSRIESYYSDICELIPEARIIFAHGQMESSKLEQRIRAFYNKEADVLIASTIIENGIDIPDANTLIVTDSDKLGLSQMYQLKGRVGRRGVLAFAYFTVPPTKSISESAQKRLNALMDYTDLGSGYKIAMRDLEIRGAGNVLGRDQSGHLEKVGYDMYIKLLKETVSEIKGEPIKRLKEVEFVLDMDAYLSSSYVTSSIERVKIYKKIAELQNLNEKKKLSLEISDAYGHIPYELENLINVGLMKNLAAEIGVKKVVINSSGTGVYFYDSLSPRDERIFKAVGEMSKVAAISGTEALIIFKTKGLTNLERMANVLKFLTLAV